MVVLGGGEECGCRRMVERGKPSSGESGGEPRALQMGLMMGWGCAEKQCASLGGEWVVGELVAGECFAGFEAGE